MRLSKSAKFPRRGDSGRQKQGAAFSYKHEVGLYPMVGVVGETADVLGVRARGGSAQAGGAMASFVDECVTAVPRQLRGRYHFWLRIDSAGRKLRMIVRRQPTSSRDQLSLDDIDGCRFHAIITNIHPSCARVEDLFGNSAQSALAVVIGLALVLPQAMVTLRARLSALEGTPRMG